jgi:CheY-like chemotaxis protein
LPPRRRLCHQALAALRRAPRYKLVNTAYQMPEMDGLGWWPVCCAG